MLFRFTRPALASGYTLFLKASKGKLRGVGGPERARIYAAQWKALPKEEIEKYKVAAKSVKWAPPRKSPNPVRHVPPFAKFVHDNYSSVAHLPLRERLGALSKSYADNKKAGRAKASA